MRDPRTLVRTKAVLLFCVTIGCIVSACEDPSAVGLGVLGESGVEPVRLHLAAAERPADFSPTVTSNIRSSVGFTTGAARLLTGSVVDPIFGTLKTKAYLDVALTSSQTTDYQGGTISNVELHLNADYVYGDTTATTSLIVSGMDADWPFVSMTSDTTLQSGDEILRLDYVYQSDSTLVIPLPEAWYASNSSALLSPDVGTRFHGFELTTTDPAAVIGFSATSGFLRIVTTTGTADLLISRIFTAMERLDDANVPPGRAILQDGVGQGLALSFDFTADSLVGSAISRAVVEVVVDDESMGNVPEHFVRPTPPQFEFVGVRSDGTIRALRLTTINDGKIRFVSATAAPGEFTIVRVIQEASVGQSEFDEYRIRISEVQAAANPLLVFAPSAESNGPRAIVTVTPNAF